MIEKKQIVGFTAGNFDLMHPGYIYTFEDAKKHCDKFIRMEMCVADILKNGVVDNGVPETQQNTICLKIMVDYDFALSKLL